MSIGPDIKEAIVEVGTKFTIIRDAGNITGGYLDFETNAQVTKPFIREFFLEAQFCYDTLAVGGDIIQFLTTLDYFIVMNSSPNMFENAVISYDVVLYKTNITITILRPIQIRDPNTYQMRTIWTTVVSGKPALLTSPLYGTFLDTDEELGLLQIERDELYVPVNYGIQALDRILLTTGQYYRIEAVKQRRYSNVEVVDVGEDIRPTSTSTTSTTSTTTTTV